MSYKYNKVGLIGLGAMGSGMAYNLHQAGYLTKIWNRTQSTAQSIADKLNTHKPFDGVASSASELAAECELIILCLANDEVVIEVINTIQATLKPDTIIVDTSTINASIAIKAADMIKDKALFLDAPVSGGVEGAKQGSLSMMVGGNEKALNQVTPCLQAIAQNIIYLGQIGNGQKCKAVNQIMCAGINQAVTEALAFGQAMNLDMDKVLQVVSAGAAANWFLDHRGKSMLAGEYQTGFKLALHHKDLKICQSMLEQLGEKSLPTLAMTILHYQRLIDQGYGDEDISTLFRIKQKSLEKDN